MIKPKKPRFRRNVQEHKVVQALDDLAEFESFQTEILPTLRKAIKERWTPEKVYKEFSAHMAAKAVSIALVEKDPTKSLAAIKEVLDRSQGKATEKREVIAKYATLQDQELDALIESELKGTGENGKL